MFQAICKCIITVSFWLGVGANISSAQPPKELTNSIGMKLVLIPKGSFMMGMVVDDAEQHQVTISQNYYLGVTEVTQEQYERVMGNNPSLFQRDEIKGSSSDHPVDSVSWDDAVEFCKKLSDLPKEKKAGRVYRLPTEAEWEYACRAGSKTRHSFGDDEESLGDYAWFDGNSNEQTHPVGQKKANAWGLYDMHGNVWEWCSDWYGDYPKGAVSDPIGPREGSDRVRRGGSCSSYATFCQSAHRQKSRPFFWDFHRGFRIALSPSTTPQGGDELKR